MNVYDDMVESLARELPDELASFAKVACCRPDESLMDRIKNIKKQREIWLDESIDPDDLKLDHFRYALFAYLQDERSSRPAWRVLQSRGEDRDELIFRLALRLERDADDWPEELGSRADFLRHCSTWFLRRYDLVRARSVLWNGGWLAGSAHWVLLLLVAACYFAFLASDRGLRSGSLWILAAYAFVLFAWWAGTSLSQDRRRRRDMAPGWSLGLLLSVAQTLPPRLLGAVTIGFVVLASSGEMAEYVVGRSALVTSAVCWSTAFVYLILEVERRIHPRPHPKVIARRALDPFVVGLAHAGAVALLGRGALQGIISVARGEGGAEAIPDAFEGVLPQAITLANPDAAAAALTFSGTLNVASVTLVIGILLEIIWSKESVTEPL